MSFQDNIKQWVNIDNQIKAHNNQIKELRQTKHNLTDNIIGYVETNSLDDAIVEITDGNLKFQNIKHTSPLTFTFLEKCLNQCIGNEEQVKQIITFIKESREVKYTPDIKRTYVN